MTLQDVASVFQIVGTLGTLGAATAAAFSARASRRAVEESAEENQRSNDERAQKFRPQVAVDVMSDLRTGEKFKGRLLVTSNETERVVAWLKIEVAERKYAYREVQLGKYVIGPGEKTQSRFPMIRDRVHQESDFKHDDDDFESLMLRGRIDYGDELGLARWNQRFRIVERAAKVDGEVRYEYSIRDMTPPRRRRPHEYEDEPSPEKERLRQRVARSWRVLRGR